MTRSTKLEREARRLLSGSRYARLFALIRRALEERGEAAHAVGLSALSAAEREALADLLGAPVVPPARGRLQLRKLDAVLRESRLDAGLVEVVEALGGALVDRRAERAAARDAREVMWTEAGEHRAVAGRPTLVAWLDGLRRTGALARAVAGTESGEEVLLDAVLDVVARLPASGVLRQVLAAHELGDPHGLDDDRPATNIVLRAAAALAGWPETPRTAAGRRRLWAEVGVLCDPLSSHVLVLGLRPRGEDRLARALCEAADEGEPQRLTLRELKRGGVLKVDARDVFICENPAVVNAAAERLGANCTPLVCVEGVPSTAALRLLARLRDGGARLRAHADFDWGGLKVMNQLVNLLGVEPWRYSTSEYEVLAEASPSAVPLRGHPVEASWAPALAAALQQRGVAVFEEQALDGLLADLEATFM